jgi:hypothetical protein
MNIYRIVKVLRGDLVTGFRVQILRRSRMNGDTYWRNTGKVQYTIESARELRDFLVKHENHKAPETVEVIDGPAEDTSWHIPYPARDNY